MKKFWCFTLLAALVLSLAACGASSEPANQEPMTESDIRTMYSNPDAYKGRPIELTGQVFTAPEYDEDGVYFQMYQDPANYENNTIIGYADPEFTLSTNDYVKIVGTVTGSFEGENAFGAKLTVPTIKADSIEISTYQDVVAPTLTTIIPDEPTKIQCGYSVTIEKIELAAAETRVYVKVENAGSDKFSLYSFNSYIVQNGKQFNEENNYMAGYPSVQTDLSVGASTDGIFCFPAIENADFQLTLEGYSNNWQEDISPFVFDITIS